MQYHFCLMDTTKCPIARCRVQRGQQKALLTSVRKCSAWMARTIVEILLLEDPWRRKTCPYFTHSVVQGGDTKKNGRLQQLVVAYKTTSVMAKRCDITMGLMGVGKALPENGGS